MQTEMVPFLQEGVRQYVEAKHTVAAFEDAMWETLRKAVDARKDWSPLISPRPDRRPTIGGGGKDGYWIATGISGLSPRKEDAEIDCGFWWTFDKPNDPIVYAGFYHKPIDRVKFKWSNQEGGILSFEAYKRTFLYLPLPESLEIQDSLNRLLDALLKQLG
jgi:hypothetical protein